MKILITYDTKRGSTETIAGWMKEALEGKAEATVCRATENPSVEDFDLIIAGSPIYYERPLKSVVEFLKNNRESLKDKKVAIFVVCIAQLFGKPGKTYAEKNYLKSLTKLSPQEPISTLTVKGWLKKPALSQKPKIQKWILSLLK